MPVWLHLAVALQFPKGGNGVHGQPSALERRTRLTAKAGTLGSCHLPDICSSLNQQNVFDARLCQAVGNPAANGAATDNDIFRVPDRVHKDQAVSCLRYQRTNASTLYSLKVE